MSCFKLKSAVSSQTILIFQCQGTLNKILTFILRTYSHLCRFYFVTCWGSGAKWRNMAWKNSTQDKIKSNFWSKEPKNQLLWHTEHPTDNSSTQFWYNFWAHKLNSLTVQFGLLTTISQITTMQNFTDRCQTKLSAKVSYVG